MTKFSDLNDIEKKTFIAKVCHVCNSTPEYFAAINFIIEAAELEGKLKDFNIYPKLEP